ncbi:MAG TPA: hypothetical protein VFM48_01975, partial [Aquabacterium sp.]|nr:hypothetical protein [Aquabacterium sp.]
MTSSTYPSVRHHPLRLSTVSQWTTLTAALFMALPIPLAQAGVTDIAAQPLATTSPVQAKPNLLFVLDNSGSMSWGYMPDDMWDTSTYGYASAQCNGVAYDPSLTYSPPVNADGTSYANASFTAAKNDGYVSSSITSDLTGKAVYYVYTGSQPKMGWRYTTSGVTANTFYDECMSVVGDSSSTGYSVFKKVTVSASSAEAQNYANWFSYYRKRYLMVRSSLGRALLKLDDSYRVGFTVISDPNAFDTTLTDTTHISHFRDVKDFDTTQKRDVFSSLYDVYPNGSTPLRGALSKAGRYFAKKAPGQTYDPVQYSCQRNYALLSTDGYWNTNDE